MSSVNSKSLRDAFEDLYREHILRPLWDPTHPQYINTVFPIDGDRRESRQTMAIYTEKKFTDLVELVRWRAVLMDQARQAKDLAAYDAAYKQFEGAKLELSVLITAGLDLTPPPRPILKLPADLPEATLPPALVDVETAVFVPAAKGLMATSVEQPVVIETTDGPVTATATDSSDEHSTPAIAEPVKSESER